MKLLFATKNPGKYSEFKNTFEKFSNDFEVISFNELNYEIPDCEETGKTFEENAILKVQNARAYLHPSDANYIVVADDSGMEIEALHGEPGVRTRRWAGYEMSDDEVIEYCLEKIKDKSNRNASYISCFAISIPGIPIKVISDSSKGVLLEAPRENSRLTGMPFRSLFFVPDLNMMFHEVRGLSEKDRGDYHLGHEKAIKDITKYVAEMN